MVDVEHHQTVQMTAHQLTPRTFLALAVLRLHRCLIKLVAAELEGCERLLQIVSPCEQLLVERFLLPLLLAGFGLQASQCLEYELLVVRVRSPFLQFSLVLGIDGMQDSPARVDVKGCR